MKLLTGMGRALSPKTAVALAAMWACVTAAMEVTEPWPTAMMAPAGYTGAINTPTADVLPWGSAVVGVTNSNPERVRTKPQGHFGSLNAGVGLLPGLELVGRLSYEGDFNCNLYDPRNCTGGQRDLSLSGKYQLPLELPLDTRVAFGFTDYGGNAAIFYRQVYGVATSTLGMLDLSVGYSKPMGGEGNFVSHPLMDGVFGNAVLRINERWAAAVEHDSREVRAGVHYTQPLTDQVSVQGGLSRKLTDRSGQQPWQATVALNLALGSVERAANNAVATLPTTRPETTPGTARAPLDANALAADLVAHGFAHVQVKHWPAQAGQPALWQVRAEPRRWRQSQVDALGVALGRWMKLQGQAASQKPDELVLSLTYQREPVLHAHTSATCLDSWLQGWSRCELNGAEGGSRPVRLSRAAAAPATWWAGRVLDLPMQEALQEGGAAWLPQVEVGPSLRTHQGTEVGLFDYSLALEVAAEVGLAPGLFWQGVASAPLSHSDDFGDGRVFASRRHPEAGLDTSLLTYWKALPGGVAVQGSAGYLERRYKGAQGDAVWMNADGRWRLSATAGQYRHETTGNTHSPALGAVRYSVVPGAWQLEATAGKFLSRDVGVQLASMHWLGDTQFKMFYSRSKGPAGSNVEAQKQFLGFTVSVPLGPKAAQPVAGVNVRGTDRWSWGAKTKIRENDNRVTFGYAEMPSVRHGVQTDVVDHDRGGVADMVARAAVLRERVAEQLR